MKSNWLRGLIIAAAIALFAAPATVEARRYGQRALAQNYSWHHNYYDPAWGPEPHALVVPPGVNGHVEYNWGVAGTDFLPIPHQYHRGIGGGLGLGAGPFAPAPVVPYSTNQMGVYYIRAPR